MKKLLLLLLLNLNLAPAWAALPSLITSLANIIDPLMPAVVNIDVQGEIAYGPSSEQIPNLNSIDEAPPNTIRSFSSLGSGVIVNAKQGYILTNAHLFAQVGSITVTLSDGRRLLAKLIGSDPASDIAVLQIYPDKLVAMPLADSDTLKVGDFVVAIGNPYGLDHTVTSGIISALQRNNLGIEGYENFIQTDATINPGNSGGALVNLKGKLIGINTAILSTRTGGNSGIGFAIPSNMARSVMQQLIEYGSVNRGVVGLGVQSMTPELAPVLRNPSTEGAIVTQIMPVSPAAIAGIRVGDIILKINDNLIKDGPTVHNIIGLLRTGTRLNFKLLRQGKPYQVSLTAIDPKQYKAQLLNNNPYLFGLNLQDFDQALPGQGRIQGVLVLQVTKSSVAARAIPPLRRGDVIVSANQQSITNLNHLLQVAKQSKNGLLLNIQRGNAAFFVLLK